MNQQTTYNPQLIDNESLLEGQEIFENAQVSHKATVQMLEGITLGIKDAYNNNKNKSITELRNQYADEKDFLSIGLHYYQLGFKIFNNCTQRQSTILYKYIVERKTLTDISKELNITPAGVFKSISLIRNNVKNNLRYLIAGMSLENINEGEQYEEQ